jgi:hypothetical protein
MLVAFGLVTVGLDAFTSSQTHLVVDFTVTSARTNSSVLVVGAPFPLLGILTVGAQHAKPEADYGPRASGRFGAPSIYSVYDFYPSILGGEGWGWLVPLAVELVDRIIG